MTIEQKRIKIFKNSRKSEANVKSMISCLSPRNSGFHPKHNYDLATTESLDKLIGNELFCPRPPDYTTSGGLNTNRESKLPGILSPRNQNSMDIMK